MGSRDDFSAADEQRIRDLLAAQPRPQMPADVEARIAAALAAEPRPTFLPASEHGPGTGRRWLGVAVAAAFVVLAGVILVPQLRQQSAPVAETTIPANSADRTVTLEAPVDPAAAECVPDTLMYDSGTRYQQAALITQAQALVPPPCRTPSGSDAEAVAAVPPPLTPAVAERSLKCIVRVARTPAVILIDRGSYEGRPAVVAVVDAPRRALAVDCRQQPAQVLMDVDLP